jgi:hypothetical protein
MKEDNDSSVYHGKKSISVTQVRQNRLRITINGGH